MTITLTLGWWAIPAAVSLIGLIWALFIVKGDGFLGGLNNIFAIGAVAVASAIAWAIAGFLK